MRIHYLGIAFIGLLAACSDDEGPGVQQAPVVEDTPPSPAPPQLATPVLVPAWVSTFGTRSDLTDPTAEAICAGRDTDVHAGHVEADDSFDIWGDRDVSVEIHGDTQLDLQLGWYGYSSEDDHAQRIRREDRSTYSFVPNAASDFAAGDFTGRLYEVTATRQCNAAGGSYGAPSGAKDLGAAGLTIRKRTASQIEGRILLYTAGCHAIDFSAPLGALLPHDDSVCCLAQRPVQEVPPDPTSTPPTADEVAALCKARDAEPPAGTIDADPELTMGVIRDVRVSEGFSDVLDADRRHHYRSTFTLEFLYPRVKGTNPPTESESWELWNLSRGSDTGATPFVPGRYEGLDFGGSDGGTTCGDGFGQGGSSSFSSNAKATLVITARTDDLIEGEVEIPQWDDPTKTGKLRFKTKLRPPPPSQRPIVCCNH